MNPNYIPDLVSRHRKAYRYKQQLHKPVANPVETLLAPNVFMWKKREKLSRR